MFDFLRMIANFIQHLSFMLEMFTNNSSDLKLRLSQEHSPDLICVKLSNKLDTYISNYVRNFCVLKILNNYRISIWHSQLEFLITITRS